MEERYPLNFNLAAIRYLRAVLGRQPHDEVAPLIADIAAQCEQHDKARQAPGAPQPLAAEPHALPNGAQEVLQ
jgi:hypothetical protein